jgi:hypothetical protein
MRQYFRGPTPRGIKTASLNTGGVENVGGGIRRTWGIKRRLNGVAYNQVGQASESGL